MALSGLPFSDSFIVVEALAVLLLETLNVFILRHDELSLVWSLDVG